MSYPTPEGGPRELRVVIPCNKLELDRLDAQRNGGEPRTVAARRLLGMTLPDDDTPPRTDP